MINVLSVAVIIQCPEILTLNISYFGTLFGIYIMHKFIDVNSAALHWGRGILQVNRYIKHSSVGPAVSGPKDL